MYTMYTYMYTYIYIYILVLMFPNICPIFMLVDGLSFQLVNSAALAEVISQSSVGSATSKCRRRSTMWGDELTPCYGIIPLVYWYTTGISSGKCVFLLLFVKNIPDHWSWAETKELKGRNDPSTPWNKIKQWKHCVHLCVPQGPMLTNSVLFVQHYNAFWNLQMKPHKTT
jgi:hypothetical protein